MHLKSSGNGKKMLSYKICKIITYVIKSAVSNTYVPMFLSMYMVFKKKESFFEQYNQKKN